MKLEIMKEKLKRKPKKKQKYKPYVPRDGFVRRKLRRGMNANLNNLLEIISPFNAIICGGYARWAFSMREESPEPTDVDIYCQEEESYKPLFDQFLQSGLRIKNENEISVMFLDRKNSPWFPDLPPIQLIKPMKEARIVAVGNVKEILSNFDFTVCRCAITSPKMGIVDADYAHDEKHKILRIKNIHCPISSTLRFAKYHKKGYSIPPFEVLKLFRDWEDRDEQYRIKIIQFFKVLHEKGELTDEQINKMERLMRID